MDEGETMQFLVAIGQAVGEGRFGPLRWRSLSALLFFISFVFLCSPSALGFTFGPVTATFAVAAFFGRRAFYVHVGAFFLAIAGVSSCAAVEASLNTKTCAGKREVWFDPSPQPEDFICW